MNLYCSNSTLVLTPMSTTLIRLLTPKIWPSHIILFLSLISWQLLNSIVALSTNSDMHLSSPESCFGSYFEFLCSSSDIRKSAESSTSNKEPSISQSRLPLIFVPFFRMQLFEAIPVPNASMCFCSTIKHVYLIVDMSLKYLVCKPGDSFSYISPFALYRLEQAYLLSFFAS